MLQAATRLESAILARQLTRIYPLGGSSVVGISAGRPRRSPPASWSC